MTEGNPLGVALPTSGKGLGHGPQRAPLEPWEISEGLDQLSMDVAVAIRKADLLVAADTLRRFASQCEQAAERLPE